MPVVLNELWKCLKAVTLPEKEIVAVLRPPTPRFPSCTLLLPAALVQAGGAGCLAKALV